MTGGRRVAITGIGAITALGHDLASLWAGVSHGVSGIRPIANIPTERLIVTHAAEVAGFDPAAHFETRRLPMLDRTSQLALVAAREAMAAITVDRMEPSRAGVVLGAVSYTHLDVYKRQWQWMGLGAFAWHGAGVCHG